MIYINISYHHNFLNPRWLSQTKIYSIWLQDNERRKSLQLKYHQLKHMIPSKKNTLLIKCCNQHRSCRNVTGCEGSQHISLSHSYILFCRLYRFFFSFFCMETGHISIEGTIYTEQNKVEVQKITWNAVSESCLLLFNHFVQTFLGVTVWKWKLSSYLMWLWDGFMYFLSVIKVISSRQNLLLTFVEFCNFIIIGLSESFPDTKYKYSITLCMIENHLLSTTRYYISHKIGLWKIHKQSWCFYT